MNKLSRQYWEHSVTHRIPVQVLRRLLLSDGELRCPCGWQVRDLRHTANEGKIKAKVEAK